MELLKKRLANLLSVKSIVTLCLTITFCVLTVQAKVTQEFNTAYLMVIAKRKCATAGASATCARTWRRIAGRCSRLLSVRD